MNRDQPIRLKRTPQNLSEPERQLFAQYGVGRHQTPKYGFVHQGFEEYAKQNPNQIAAIHQAQSITYGELNTQADSLARKLVSLGVQAHDNVGLFLERSIPMLVGILAILKTGAAYVPQDARIAPTSQLSHIAATSKLSVLLTISKLRHLIPLADGQICLDIDKEMTKTARHKKTRLPDFNSLDDRAANCFLLFTSGTTGMPNGVEVTHRNLTNILMTEPGDLGIKPGMIVSQILNIAFDMAAWEILGALTKGATLLIRGKDIEKAVQAADVVIATPSILASIDANRCRNVKTVAVAGEPCPIPLAEKWSEFANFYNSCGPTEVTIVNTMHRFIHATEKISIGKPNPNTTVYILDENLDPCPIGEIGEMWAGGDCVTKGYRANPQLTNERYRPDPFLEGGKLMFRTRDLGRWNDKGELEHYGRTDDQVKVRGFRVELDSVSMALESVPKIDQAITLKLDDRNLATFVTPSDVDTRVALEAVTSRLPYYCKPSFICAMDQLPKTDRGKTDKRALTILATKIQNEELGA